MTQALHAARCAAVQTLDLHKIWQLGLLGKVSGNCRFAVSPLHVLPAATSHLIGLASTLTAPLSPSMQGEVKSCKHTPQRAGVLGDYDAACVEAKAMAKLRTPQLRR